MMKVYDMVTGGMYDPDEIAPPSGYETPQALRPSEVPAPQLQMLQITPTPRADILPPSLRTADIDRFLETFGD
jgi:hypothetical protein